MHAAYINKIIKLSIVPCLRELSYRSGIVDRPGSFYDMQNNIEEELETSSDDAQTVESK